MASEMELLRAGVAALQAGNREGAVTLLSQVVDLNPYNEQAWFYLAAADHDPFMRKRYLERVLELNPGNSKARDILDKLLERERAAINPTHPTAPSTPKPPSGSKPESGSRPGSPETPRTVPPVILSGDTWDAPPKNARSAPIEPAEPPMILSWDAPVSADPDPDDFDSRATGGDALPDPDDFAPLRRRPASRTTTPYDDEDLLASRLGSDPSEPRTEKSNVSFATLRPLAPDAGSLLGAALGDTGFALPIDIPGAPARISLGSFLRGGVTLLRASVRILTRRRNAYAQEIERASWWRYWLYALFTSVIQTVLFAFTIWFVEGRVTAEFAASGRIFNIAAGLVMLLLGVPFYIGTLMGGAGISWLVLRTWLKLRPPYLKHLYAVTLVWLPLSLAATVLAFVFNLLNLFPVNHYSLLAILSTLGLSAFAAFTLYDAVRHFEGEMLMDEKERRKRRIAGASAVIGIFAVRLIVGLVLSAITGAGLVIFLFT
ncbi:MAG: hypothetical protein SF162_00255 [bacterium]|nr:hypothetical protein [bacterium]